MKDKIRQAISNLESDLIAWRRSIHRQPELGFEEYKTADKIVGILQETGLDFQTEVAQTGVVADLQLGDDLPTLALRADMDALPIQEQTGVEYASQKEGVMHACGHDGHVAILLGTAVILDQFRAELNINLRFIFQPAEEGPGGAKPMIEEGVLEDVAGIIGLHLNTDQLTGELELKSGVVSAAADQIELVVTGEGGHGAAPHQTVDTVVVAAEIVTALQTVVSRKVAPHHSVVLSMGKIEGGYRHNVIADQVKLTGTVRSTDPAVREELPDKIEEIIKGITTAHGADYELDYKRGYPVMISNDELVTGLEKSFSGLPEIKQVTKPDHPSMGAEDFAYYCQQVPGAFYRLGAGKFPDCSYPGHHPKFNFDEAALELGVITFVEAVLNQSNSEGKDLIDIE
ncbi:M20 metallopeptidase family protein [Acetohalobium arabaticum]|uniref:Amidohydrolase n=1 Tax=Acetohalobium arabaticum (strain ATCC 49924 / DSM 5501 / Z-7288) TaxID=574087 RepID=D9QT84_ACEAZ|nr:amidohydrolase [Acetohalobium arabaticum]ADL13584.1 amidohydrolase [Acetohalobium arabaticum DSM 5501]